MTVWRSPAISSRIGLFGGGEDQARQIQHALEFLLVVDHIDEVERHHLFGAGAYFLDSLVDGGVPWNGHHLGLHQTAGGVLGIFEEGLDLVAFLGRKGLDQVARQRCWQVGENVGRVVRCHGLDGLAQLVVWEVLGEIVP